MKGIKRITTNHYPMIRQWYEARGKAAPSVETFSDLGWIADGRVAGWLYLTNSNMALIEGIIADPHSVPSLRKDSLRKLAGHLVDTALDLGYSNIFGITRHPSIDSVCKQLGFRSQEFRVWALSDKE